MIIVKQDESIVSLDDVIIEEKKNEDKEIKNTNKPANLSVNLVDN